MSRYRVSLAAQADVSELLEYIAGQSLQNAELVLQRLTDAFEKIAETPGMGHFRDDLPDDRFRVLAVSGYLVIYKDASPLAIVRVFRGTRDIARIRLPRDMN